MFILFAGLLFKYNVLWVMRTTLIPWLDLAEAN